MCVCAPDASRRAFFARPLEVTPLRVEALRRLVALFQSGDFDPGALIAFNDRYSGHFSFRLTIQSVFERNRGDTVRKSAV